MNITFVDILKNYNLDKKYDNDFTRKYKNGCYDLEEQLSLEHIFKFLTENNYMEEFLNEISSIKKDALFNSFGHGYFHNERVLFNAFLIGKLRNVSNSGMRILMDAAKYHDIGRINDLADDAHGLVSANKVERVIGDNPFYKEGENLNILKFIIDYHSTKDSYLESFLENYDIKDKDLARELAKILKDSDGLDRVRLSMGQNFSELDTTFLRTEESKRLVKASHQLNELYLNTFKKELGQDDLDEFKEEFGDDLYLHSVGLDFFKLESIIKNGILSKNKLIEKGINSTKNFDGCNFDDYVSVAIYGDEFYSIDNSYDKHVRGGMIFVIGGINSLEGEQPKDITYYDYKNRKDLVPINMGGYTDERFVKDEITLDKIKNLIIPKQLLDLKLTDINYLSDTISLEILESQIRYFLSIVEEKTSSKIDSTFFEEEIKKIKILEEKRKTKFIALKDYEEGVKALANTSNRGIGVLINNMYQNLLSKEDVRARDVIDDIFLRNNLSPTKEDDNNLYINLGETKKLT